MPKTRTAYILLFRGVGGATQLPTAPLRAALTEAGFENVATYINSGNAVVRSVLSREEVIASVAKIGEDRFGFNKAIYAPTLAEWEALVANNPFPDFEVPKYLHAAVLAGEPNREISGLEDKVHALVRLSTTFAVDAGQTSYQLAVERALAAGATPEEIAGTLIAVVGLTGVPRAVAAAPMLALALGYDVEAALEGLDG